MGRKMGLCQWRTQDFLCQKLSEVIKYPLTNIPMKSIYTSIIICFLNSCVFAQIAGKVVDEDKNGLPGATVYIEHTTKGTVANNDGEYNLLIDQPGTYKLVFQYIGYKTESRTVTYIAGKPVELDINLEPEDYVVEEVTISADREDPAYPIIRSAIAKRDFYKHQAKSIEADLYVKGKVQMLDAPMKIFGQDIGNMGGVLDTSRQGILYLSESTSKYYFQDPNKTKEVMLTSVKSGDNDFFTANRFQMFKFDVYDEYYRFVRTIASPISDNALSHYKYRLESSFYNEDKEKVYKIKLIPKSENDPLLVGDIYIMDGYFNVHSLDVTIGGATLRGSFLDSIHFKQIYVPVGTSENRRLLSQVVNFKGGILAFKIGGTFTYIFSNYILDKDLSQIFKNNENFSIDKNALKVDSNYWKSARPVPLTQDEERDYIKKDSLSKIWKSKPFLDSLDRANNKFKFIKLLTGYSYQNSHKNYELKTPNLTEIYAFNPIEGSRFKAGLAFEREDSIQRFVRIGATAAYGIVDKQWKPHAFFKRIYDNYHSAEVYGQIGRKYWQFDHSQPITTMVNTNNNLFLKINRAKYYDLRIAELGWKRELLNGLYFDVSTSYQDRRPLSNLTNYSFYRKEKVYSSNKPNESINDSNFEANKYWVAQTRVTLRPFQKYSSYPNIKVPQPSAWPVIEWFVNGFVGLTDNASSFLGTTLTIRDNYVSTRLIGYTRYRVSGGTFLGGKPSYFADFFHAPANESLLPFIRDQLGFNIMPFYKYSTDRYFLQAHWRHHLNGYLFSHVPLINKTSWKEVFGLAGHYDPKNGQYYEPMIGIEDIKIKGIKICDIEYTWSFDGTRKIDQGIVFKLSRFFDR
jgi:hypothetical protein